MKRIQILLIFFSAVCSIFLSSCASGPETQGHRLARVPKPGKGLVLIYRPSGFVGAAAVYNIYANDQQIADGMGRGKYISYDANPGPLILATRRKLNASTALFTTILAVPTLGTSVAATAIESSVLHKTPAFNVVAGETYYVPFSGKMQPVPKEEEEDAEDDLEGCELHNPPQTQ